MLDNDKQINAYIALSAASVVTPFPVVVCQEIASHASVLAAAINALLLAGATYPASVSAYTGKIPDYVTSCSDTADVAKSFITAVNPFSSPSELVQLKTGWDCHVRGNRLSPAPDFALVAAMGDRSVTRPVLERISLITDNALTSAMAAINAKVSAAAAPAAGSDTGTTAAPAEPVFTDAEIKALKDATTALDDLFQPLPALNAALTNYTNQVNTSTSTAKKALSNAVAIALTDGLRTDSVMGQAIAAIMPAAVMAALT